MAMLVTDVPLEVIVQYRDYRCTLPGVTMGYTEERKRLGCEAAAVAAAGAAGTSQSRGETNAPRTKRPLNHRDGGFLRCHWD